CMQPFPGLTSRVGVLPPSRPEPDARWQAIKKDRFPLRQGRRSGGDSAARGHSPSITPANHPSTRSSPPSSDGRSERRDEHERRSICGIRHGRRRGEAP
uniref:Uncharacterized protein n=1 Tax=Aegilops tauschii subsp. strangulata TaxID=200361 RepID=A0A453FH91_AEGTS